MKNFVGTGKRLSQGDIGDAARAVGLPTAALLAWIEVEAAGRGFDTANRPKILPERHVFWRLLGAGAVRTKAASLGLAYAKWGTKPYPRSSSDRYTLLGRMIDVAKAAALGATSWGLPQILGSNHKSAGFASAELMVRAMMQGEREQLLAMVALMQDWGLPALLKGKDLSNPDSWRPAARRYNGPAYAKHNYHGRMAAAYVKHSRADGVIVTIPAPAARVLRMGMKGEAVRNLQADLAALGFSPGPVDGRYGVKTWAAVRALQTAEAIQADGEFGPQTRSKLREALARLKVEAPEPELVWDRADGWLVALVRWLVELFTSRRKAK